MTPPTPKRAHLLRASDFQFEYREKSNPQTSNLDLLTYGTYRTAPGGSSAEIYHRQRETILFSLRGTPTVEVAGKPYTLPHYDTLYIPTATPYRVIGEPNAETLLAVCSATSTKQHPVHHSSWNTIRADEGRIRHLEGKDVFLMFDVTEPAEKLIAGYTIYEPYTRAWPPHNHTDQEEIYIFTQGKGAMEVYAEEKTKTFVHSMNELDAATIPLLNYHPVYSQEDELHFIWCLAGNRYWIGDKHKEFMNASVDSLTT